MFLKSCGPPALITTYCELDIANFPFDQKKCELTWASWMYTDNFVMLESGSKALTNQYTGKYLT